MTHVLCMTIRFLDPVPQFHGRSNEGTPEWPPSPLRLFQALVAAMNSGWKTPEVYADAQAALNWLGVLRPIIVSPTTAAQSYGYRSYVPNNSGDLMTAAWARGDIESSMAKFRVEKDVRPLQMHDDAVHYLFPLPDEAYAHFNVLRAGLRSITHLGWGIDIAVGDARIVNEEEANKLVGDRWHPSQDVGGAPLRVPMGGTFDELVRKQQAFLNRFQEGFRPVPPLAAFQVVNYRRSNDPPALRWAAFELLKPDLTGNRAFHPGRHTRNLAGMLRHTIDEAAKLQGWSPEKRAMFIHGKSPSGGLPTAATGSWDRFRYLPLPTINPKLRRVESARRILVAAPAACSAEIDWAARSLAGMELTSDEQQPQAVLNILPKSDWVLRQYIGRAKTWATVTPVILPGYDDPKHLRRKLKACRDANTQKRYLDQLDERTRGLLTKAFLQAGFTPDLLAECRVEYCLGGYFAGVDLAKNYLPPENLSAHSRYHVRVEFPQEISGPLAVGSGRFRGFGLFAAMRD